MATTAVTHSEEHNRRKGAITSFIIHIALLAIALLPLMTFPDPPPGQEGILVALGEPDRGQGDEKPAVSPSEEVPVAEELPEETEPEVDDPEPEPEPVKEEPKREEPKKVNTDDNSRELALKKEKERKEKLAKEREEKRKKAERDAKLKAEREAKRKAEEAARKKAEAEAKKKAEADKLKSDIGDLFGGSGQGNKDKPGSQGDPNGDPDATRLEGISTGSGTIGGGLGNRGGSGPPITDRFNKPGKVVIKVCVDASGQVTSAKFTQKGSTSNDALLKKLAIANAKKYKFSRGSIDKQCGTITYDFKVK